MAAWDGALIGSYCTELAGTLDGHLIPAAPGTPPAWSELRGSEAEVMQEIEEYSGLDDLARYHHLVRVPPGGACDATLRVEFTATALSATYLTTNGEMTLYTGSDVNGLATLAAPGRPTLVYPFHALQEPSGFTADDLFKVNEPIDGLLNNAYVSLAVNSAIVWWFGPCEGCLDVTPPPYEASG